MPISSPPPYPNRSVPQPSKRLPNLRRLLFTLLLPACLLLAAACSPVSAQVLVKPGWKDSGLTADPWWKRAIFYEIPAPPDTDFKALSVRLDALKSLDVDALILPAPALPAPGSNGPMPNLDDFDNLLREASRHGIRVLLTIHASSANADLSGLARFWLNRGVAGLHIASPAGATAEDTQALVQSVRKLASGILGQRILLSDLDLAAAESDQQSLHRVSATRSSRGSGALVAQLQIDTRANSLTTLEAASLRPLLTRTSEQPNLLLDLPAPVSSPQLADAVAAIALVTHPAALIDSSANLVLEPTVEHPQVEEEPAKPALAAPSPPPGTFLPFVPYVPPAKPKPVEAPKTIPVDPLTNWYEKLAALHHDNAVLRNGNKAFLDYDAQNALVWVSRQASQSPLTPPVVVVCNLSSSPVELSLTAAMKSLNLHGAFLRTLLRTDTAMGGQDLDLVKVPAFGVYIGELRR
jgi:alpha-glucosidase